MKVFPDNESEKPVIKQIISDFKKRNNINGRTIRVADKGLNCSDNIINALVNGDGYIFSKSIKQLPEIEKQWVLLDNDYYDTFSYNGELLYITKSCIGDFKYTIVGENGKKKNVLVRKRELLLLILNCM